MSVLPIVSLSLCPAKYSVPDVETDTCQCSAMPFTVSPTGFGSDHPVAVLSTNQTFSFWEVSDPTGLLEVKKRRLLSGVTNGTSSWRKISLGPLNGA